MRLPLHIIIVLAVFCCNAHAATQNSDDQPTVALATDRSGDYPVFAVTAAMTVDADIRRSWAVLTDYDRLAGFVPNLTSSQELARDGNDRTVAQRGYARFLFIHHTIDLLLHVSEQPMAAIDIRLIRGNMRKYRARWELQPADSERTRITYTGAMAPDFYVPGLFGPALIKSDLRDMLNAVKAEIERK